MPEFIRMLLGYQTQMQNLSVHLLQTGKVFPFYAFPPFSLVLKTLHKVKTEQATGVLVCPIWPTQVWFPVLMKMLVRTTLVLPRLSGTSFQTNPQTQAEQVIKANGMPFIREFYIS